MAWRFGAFALVFDPDSKEIEKGQDENPHFDNSYYRLKMIENDDKFVYSDLKIVKGTDLQHQINIFPNPFDEYLFIFNI